ncbi:MAG: response regulator [Desulfobacterota bacterium]|nr:response regulator [Thermodesulfobacteriota bacterium]
MGYAAFFNNYPVIGRKLLFVAIAVTVYIIGFTILQSYVGSAPAISVIVPVMAIAWLFGMWPGIVAGFLSLPANILLCLVFHVPDWWTKVIVRGGIPGTIALVVIGAVIGKVRSLHLLLQRNIKELQEKTAALEAVNATLQQEIETKNRTLAELRLARENLERLIDISLDPLIIVDAQGYISNPNKALLALLGYQRDELIGKPADMLGVSVTGKYHSTAGETVTIDEKYLTEARARFNELENQGHTRHWQAYYTRKDGRLVPIVQSIAYLYDAAGVKIAALVSLHDMTDQRRHERELIASKQFLEQLIDASIDPIVIGDGRGRMVRPNKAFLAMLGCREEEVVGKTSQDFSVREPGTYVCTTGEMVTIDEVFLNEQQAKAAEVLCEGKISNWMTYYRRKDNVLIPVVRSIVIHRNEHNEPTAAFSVIRDITKQLKTEKELIRAKEAAEEANRSKSAFLANMSHEIRTPMNGVIGFADLLLDTQLDEEQRGFVRTIKHSGEALLSLINDILDFSKIEAGKITLESLEFDLEVLAYDVCDLIRPRTMEKQLDLLCHIGDDLPTMVKGDPHRFRQVLLNLMGNAVKFTHTGEIELAMDAEQETDDKVLIHTTVRDTGVGIPTGKLEAIFEMFQQADETTTRRYGGSGLGLSICKRIAHLMGGDCWAESRLGVGSTFHFTAWLSKSELRQAKRIPPVALAGKKVLVTDDNKRNLNILTRILESAQMRVSPFTTGHEALVALKEAAASGDPFDICILDIRMPDLSGYELADKIRAEVSTTLPLLAFTSSPEGGARKCMESGFNGFLPKPIKQSKLFRMIERLMGGALPGVVGKPGEGWIVTQHSMREEVKHSASILLAEDNPVNQQLAVKLLTKAGYSVEVAANGREAVEKFAAQPDAYDIIFMDVQMPEMNGLDATKMLRSLGFISIPVIAMTANVIKGDREKCLESGMNDYIPKPIKRDVVFDMLRKWVIERD